MTVFRDITFFAAGPATDPERSAASVSDCSNPSVRSSRNCQIALGAFFSKERRMSRPRKAWFLLAMAVALLGSLPVLVLAGNEAKAGPKPLPPDVVKAWTAAGLEVGWFDMKPGSLPYLQKNARADALPGFLFDRWRENTLAKLPDPGAPFGLQLYGSDVRKAALQELASMKNLQVLILQSTEVTAAGLKELVGLKSLQRLELVYGRRPVTDAEMKEVASLKNLRTLRLDYVKRSDAGLKELASLK